MEEVFEARLTLKFFDVMGKIFKSLQEVTVSNFFLVKLTQNPPFSTSMK